MFKNYVVLTILGLVFFTVVSEVQSGVITDGIKKAFDNTRCRLHGITNSIHNHEHDNDPCKVKNQHEISRNNDVSSTIRRSPTPDGSNQANKNASTTNADSRRLIQAGANCPEGYRADEKGHCYLKY